MSEVDVTSGRSPFDRIRRVRPDGSEYWSARELQPLLGYDQWRNFERCVDDAQHAAGIVAAQDQFADSSKMIDLGKGGRRSVSDIEMTRYGAYMVAMACDGRKPEVAAAKTYFAIRTREAETAVVPANPFELFRRMVDQMEATDRKADEAKAIAARSEARLDAMDGHHDWYSALGYARVNGIQNTSTQFLNRVGRQASSIAKEHNIKAEKVPHALFGEVNSYPSWIWDLAFAGYEAA